MPKERLKKYKPTIVIEVHPQFVGYKETVKKFNELSNMGLNVVEVLDDGWEFVLKPSEPKISWEKMIKKNALKNITALRDRYENAKSKEEKKLLVDEYKILIMDIRPTFTKRLF